MASPFSWERQGLTQAEQRQDPSGRESLHSALAIQFAERGAAGRSQEPAAELEQG